MKFEYEHIFVITDNGTLCIKTKVNEFVTTERNIFDKLQKKVITNLK